MRKIYSSLDEAVRDLCGNERSVARRRRITRGDINEACALTLDDGTTLFMKYNSLLFANGEELRGLPPTDILTCRMDNLMEEGEAYAKKLKDAGILTTLRRFEQSRHGFLVNLMDEWQDGEDYVVSLIEKHLITGSFWRAHTRVNCKCTDNDIAWNIRGRKM